MMVAIKNILCMSMRSHRKEKSTKNIENNMKQNAKLPTQQHQTQ
jgi:hypothetical protein